MGQQGIIYNSCEIVIMIWNKKQADILKVTSV